jgi:hypothetical protein
MVRPHRTICSTLQRSCWAKRFRGGQV